MERVKTVKARSWRLHPASWSDCRYQIALMCVIYFLGMKNFLTENEALN